MSFADAVIRQAAQTMEFSLGCISSAASYLRLWALSLAHSQLQRVFVALIAHQWEGPHYSRNLLKWAMKFLLSSALSTLYIGIALIVFLGMNLPECFLHSLRLHWIEFQGKFAHSDGVKFVPFTFKEQKSSPSFP